MDSTAQQDAINQAEWENAENWTLPVGIYFSKRDTRWLVPKKNIALGWSFNLATKKGAWVFMAAMILPSLLLAAGIVAAAFCGSCH